MTMRTSLAGLAIIKEFEGCKLVAYRDVAAVWTIGWGHTGPDVKPGMVITQEDADRRLAERLTYEFEPGVLAALDGAPTTQNQFDAMVSLAYNIGVAAFKGSTVARLHRAGNYEGAASSFLFWNKARGRVIAGLVRRREDELVLYSAIPLRPATNGPRMPGSRTKAQAVRISNTPIEAAASECEIEAAVRDFESKARSLQLHLKAGGYYRGVVDGDWGPISRTALADYKTRINQT